MCTMDLTDLEDEISVSKINEDATAEVRTGGNMVSNTEDTATPALDSSDILEIQQSDLNDVHNTGVYIINDGIGTFSFNVRKSNLERVVQRRRNNDNYPDDISPEFILAREIDWIITTLSNGQRLKRYLSDLSYDQHYATVDLKPDEITVTLVYDPEY